MRFLFVVLLLLAQGAQAVALRCSNIFKSEDVPAISDMMDESGFINLYGGKPRRAPGQQARLSRLYPDSV